MKLSEQTQLFTLAELPAHLPEINGQRLDPKKLWRWIRVGVTRRCDGTVVKLWATMHGGRFVTSVEAVEAFQAELARGLNFDPHEIITTAKQRTEAERASEELREKLKPFPKRRSKQ